MNTTTVKKISALLLVLLFFMPLIGTLLMSSNSSAESKQYDGLLLAIMSMYNVPFLFVSIVGLAIGSFYQARLKKKAAEISFAISIVSSVAGIILMAAWGLKLLN